MEWRTTSTILAGLRAADEGAWGRFVDRFRAPVLGFHRRLGLGAQDAEDATQETLLAVAESLREGRYRREAGRLSHWLFGIAYRQALRERRRAARRPGNIATAGDGTTFWSGLPDEAGAAEIWDLEWERAVLQACLERVRSEFEARTVRAFEMAVRDERSPAEVAASLGEPVKMVYNAKHRVLKRIRELRREYEEAEDHLPPPG